MPLYLMSYDRHRQRDYTKIHKLMATWKAQRLLESLWLAELRGPAEVVAHYMKLSLDGDDSIAVIQLKSPSQWNTVRAKPGGVTWLRRHIPRRD